MYSNITNIFCLILDVYSTTECLFPPEWSIMLNEDYTTLLLTDQYGTLETQK